MKKNKKTKAMISKKKILMLFVFICVVLILLFTLAFLRHRQMCSYQNLINTQQLSHQSGISLCTDPFSDPASFLSNAFSYNFKEQLSFNDNFDPLSIEVRQKTEEMCIEETDPTCWISQLDRNIKESNGFTNFLVVGRDTREDEAGSGNTDSIMLISLHHETGEVLLLSFPRDLLIKFNTLDGRNEYIRINSIYAWYGSNGKQSLLNSIEQMTGKEVHYYAFIDFSVFTQVIENIEGVEITLEEPFRDAFPKDELTEMGKSCEIVFEEDPEYCIVTYPMGTQTFDSNDALIYSRARLLSSDFARARRQQHIIRAIAKQLLQNDMPIQEKLTFATSIYSTLSENVETNVKLDDITGLFSFYEKLTSDFVSIVVDPTIGNYSLVYDAGIIEGFGSVLKFYDETYSDFQEYIDTIWNFLPFIKEEPRIKVVNTHNVPIQKETPLREMIDNKNPYWELEVVRDTSIEISGIRIYDFSGGEVIESIRAIQKMVPDAFLFDTELDSVQQSNFREDILIIHGN